MIKKVYVKLFLNLIFCSMVIMSCSKDYDVVNLEEEIAIENFQNISIDDSEKGDFMLVLASPGKNKILVVKMVKEIKGCDLKTANDIVKNAPSVVLSNVKYDRAKDGKTKLEEVGATAEIK